MDMDMCVELVGLSYEIKIGGSLRKLGEKKKLPQKTSTKHYCFSIYMNNKTDCNLKKNDMKLTECNT